MNETKELEVSVLERAIKALETVKMQVVNISRTHNPLFHQITNHCNREIHALRNALLAPEPEEPCASEEELADKLATKDPQPIEGSARVSDPQPAKEPTPEAPKVKLGKK